MSEISKEMTINQILKLYPKSSAILNQFKIDTCCGGTRTIEQAVKEDKADLDSLLQALNSSGS